MGGRSNNDACDKRKIISFIIVFIHNFIRSTKATGFLVVIKLSFLFQILFNLNDQHTQKHATMTSPSIKSDDKLRKSQQQRNSNSMGTPRRSNMSLASKLGSDECASKGFLSWMRVFRLSNLMVNQGC